MPGMKLYARVELIGVGFVHSTLIHLRKNVTFKSIKINYRTREKKIHRSYHLRGEKKERWQALFQSASEAHISRQEQTYTATPNNTIIFLLMIRQSGSATLYLIHINSTYMYSIHSTNVSDPLLL
jgi:hypothetical protein